MERPLFIAKGRFDPSDGEKWRSYCDWANMRGVKEIVSLDSLLCPDIIRDVLDEDWDHNVHENFRLNYFYDVDYLMKRTADVLRKNILGIFRNPEKHIDKSPAPDFNFIGYDLIEDETGISALTNCGGFPNSFSNEELNQFGLLTVFRRAADVRQDLKKNNPEEDHANCELYAIWRLKDNSRC
jgi:hypothetical protein